MALSAGSLVMLEGDLSGLDHGRREGLTPLFVGREHSIALLSGSAEDAPEHTVLDPVAAPVGDYRIAFLADPLAAAIVADYGEVLLENDEMVLLLPDRPLPDAAIPGVHLVVPLRETVWPAGSSFLLRDRGRDGYVEDIAAAVDQDTIMAYTQQFQNYQTRHSSTDNYDTCCDWVDTKMETYGVEAEQQTFHTLGYECQNVVGEMAGVEDSTKIWIICGHLDSTSPSPQTNAPGADDNGSGSAAVLEAARVMSQYDFRYTVRFVLFGGEEQGLYGSEYYAEQASLAGDDILGVVNLDMIYYGPPGDDVLWVPYNTQSTGLAMAMEAICDTHVPSLETFVEYNPSITYSDHASFWAEGYAAVLGIEREVFSNPYYHQTTDLLENYVEYFPFGTDCTRGAIATVAYLAEPVGPTGVGGTGSTVPSPLVLSVAPNPAYGSATLSLGGGHTGPVSYSLYDVSGRRVMEGTASLDDGSATLELGAAPAGAYLLRVISPGGSDASTRLLLLGR